MGVILFVFVQLWGGRLLRTRGNRIAAEDHYLLDSAEGRCMIPGPPIEDGDLVAEALAGNRESLAALFQRHRPILVAMCNRLLRDGALAEDAAQEAMLRAFLGLDRLQKKDRFGPWLIGIGLNVCRTWLRLASRHSRESEGLVWRSVLSSQSEPPPEDMVVAADIGLRIREAINALPTGQREAVRLVYLEELDQAETAARLGIRQGAVKARLHKARTTLRDRLDGLWEGGREMAVSKAEFVEVDVADVWRRKAEEPGTRRTHAMLLEEKGGQRVLPIFIGPTEGEAIARLLHGAPTHRPLPHALMGDLLQVLGAEVLGVEVTALLETTFYAQIAVRAEKGEATVDARPSDAISLALTVGAPIRVDGKVLETAAFASREVATSQSRWGWLGPEANWERTASIVAEAQQLEEERRQFRSEQRRQSAGPRD